ncbi:MAG: hypothetical protein EDR02_07590 [Actinobacteria bacterium]|nr:MAG: hypothetical protein EDR02_07590 [Actinomycetota bacterium]RIK06979.1 MAG: hypothetical protein DCC48_05530 [Acidobacteriota bacterium]
MPPWELTAVPYRDRVGETVEIECPPDGEPTTIWGTGTYTDDSSICTAAVHAGLITLEDGGDVSIEVTEGEESYEGSEANGITSTDYGAWDGSFVFTDEP